MIGPPRRAQKWGLLLALGALLAGCGKGDNASQQAAPALPAAAAPVVDAPSISPAATPVPADPGNAAAAANSALSVDHFENLTNPPISTFEARCAACHGPMAGFHPGKIAALTSEALALTVVQMMRGNAKLPPSPADERAMIAYHGPLARPGSAGPVFIVITNAADFMAGTDPVLKGEVTPDTELLRVTPAGEVPVPVRDMQWELSGLAAKSVHLRAVLGNQRAELIFPPAAWSRVTKAD